jgi:hypothetical protein
MIKIFGAAIVVLAVVLAIVPQFTDCQSQGHYITLANGNLISMKCHWTARAQMAVAVPIAVVGLMLATSKRKKDIFGYSVVAVVLGIMSLLLAATIIGTCSNQAMFCNTTMKPVIFLTAGLISLLSLGAMIVSFRYRHD